MAGNHGDHHGEHTPGSMDIRVQEKTFDGFMTMVTRTAIVILIALVVLALVNA
jgi:fumarate reductase subunit C